MAFIYNLSDTWNDAATTWNGIKLAVTNSGSSASSNLLNLTVTGATTASFVVDKSGNLALNGTVNKVTITAPATAATLTLADNSTFITSGAYSSTFTFSGTTTLTFPTSGTVTALGNTTTGSGAIVLATGPSITLTNATGLPLATGVTGTLPIANGGTGQTTANAAFNALVPSQGGNNGKYLTTDGSNTSWATNPLGTVTSVDVSGGSTGLSFSGGPITTSGTITMAGTLAAANGGTGLTSLGTGIATWLGTPSSANLASAVTDETGSGALVFGTSPTIGSPTITGTATFNGSTSGTVALKAPAIAGTTTFTLPSGNGTSGYVLVTDGLGNTSWAVSGGAAGSAAGVNKNIQFNDGGTMAGNAAFNFDKATANLSLGIASATTGGLSFYNSASANATTIQGGNATSAVTYTLPTADGTNGQALITNGSGTLSWTTIASGLTIGSTAISGGTSGRILYDNAGVLGEKTVTGTGDVVLATSPTLVTPTLGVASATTINKVTLTAPATGSTLTIADGKTLTVSNTLTFTGTDASSVAFGAGGTVAYTGGTLAQFAATTSSQLAGVISDETGSGALVFGTSPTFTTSALFPDGSVSAPSIAHAGDTDCGFYFGTDTIYAATSGTNALTVDSGQNMTVANTLVMGSSFLRNKIINGGFTVDQRNAFASQTITAAAALAYTADRWYAYCTGANVTGQDVAGSGSDQRAYKFTGATSNTLVGFGQRIEQLNCYDLADKAVTISASMTASTNTTITWYLYTPTTTADTFGTIASPTVTQVATGTFSVTSSKTRFSAAISAAAMSGVNKGLELRFVAASGLGNAVTWTIENVQLEQGTIATSFERRQYGAELLLCQRYYWQITSVTDSEYCAFTLMGSADSTTTAMCIQIPPAQMRVLPSVSYSALGSTSVNLNDYNSRFAITGLAVHTPLSTTRMFTVRATGASGLTLYRPYFVGANGATGVWVGYSAEL